MGYATAILKMMQHNFYADLRAYKVSYLSGFVGGIISASRFGEAGCPDDSLRKLVKVSRTWYPRPFSEFRSHKQLGDR